MDLQQELEFILMIRFYKLIILGIVFLKGTTPVEHIADQLRNHKCWTELTTYNIFRCSDMDSAAVILSIGSSGNRLRLHLSRNPAAASNPRLASPNWTLYLKPHSVQKNDVIWHKTASWLSHGWPLLPFYLLDNHMHLFYQFLLQVNIWRILFCVFLLFSQNGPRFNRKAKYRKLQEFWGNWKMQIRNIRWSYQFVSM